MKKFLVVLFIILFIFSAAAFILIPQQLTVSEAIAMNANENAVFRYLSNQGKWTEWWPKESEKSGAGNFAFKGFSYQLSKILYHAVGVDIITKESISSGKISIIPLQPDSILVQWKTSFSTSNNPLVKVFRYQQAKNIKNNMKVILADFKSFSQNKDKVYAFNIRHTTLKDTFLVAIKTVTRAYPSTAEVYLKINDLRTYISKNRAKEENFPMLNVTKIDSGHYQWMVAIPTDKQLNGNGNISFKRMIVYEDKVLTANVKGGPEMIKKAYDELNTYMSDYNLATPVIHWESLVTDRSKEADSTNWITKIFVPIV